MNSRVTDQDVRAGRRTERPSSADPRGVGDDRQSRLTIDPLWAWAVFGSVVIIMTTLLFATW
jgi:hypothetical protein